MAKKTLLDNIIESIKGIDGRLIKQSGTTKQMISDLNYKVVAPAKSAADNAVRTADAAVASAKVTSDAVNEIASATAEAKAGADDAISSIQQAVANASSDAAKIRSDVAKVQDEINTAKTANESEVKSIQDDLKKTSASIDTVKGNLESVSSDLDTYAKSAADQGHDITVIKQKQGQFEVDYAGTKGDVNQIRADIKGLSESLKDSGGNIASLQATAEKLQASMSDTQKNVSDLQVTAKKYERTFEDHSGRLSKVEQTASTLTNEFSDQQGHLNQVEQTATGTKQTVANQQGQINKIKTDTDGIHETLTGQDSKIANINVTLNGLNTKYEDVSGDLDKLKDGNHKITTNSTQIDQNKKAIALKADQDTVSNLSGEVSQNTSQLKVQADQISSKVSSKDFKTLDSKVGGAISQIDKNATAIDQTNKDISLKADQTEVDKVKGTASQNSSQIKLMANEIKSKVASTDVDNIVNSKGFATTNTVQSLITQTAGTINESIVKLGQTVKQGAENNVQLVRKSDFEDGDKGGWDAQTVVTTDPPAELGQSGMKVLQTNVRDNYEDGIWYSVKPGEKFDIDFWCKPSTAYYSQLGLVFANKDYNTTWPWGWAGVTSDQSGQWKHYTGTITAPAYASFAKTWFQICKDRSNTTDTALLAKPSIRRQNATTVAAIQQITASIDGLQSNVADFKNNTSSQITQLSNLISTKVSSSDFDNLSKAVELQTLDSADINNMRTNGHYFVHNLANNPIGSWVYVDVTGNGNDRIRQDVYQDTDNQHCYRRWFGSWWTDWSKGATESEINQLSDDINLRVTKGDLISQINLQAGTSLIQSDKLVLDAKTTVFTGDAFIPSAAISNISADKIMLGSSTMYDSDGALNLVNLKDGITSKITVTQGGVNFDGIDKNASIINFASDSNINAFKVTPTGATITPTLFFERFDQTAGHWLGFSRNKVRNEGLTFHTWDDEGERFFVNCHARFDRDLSATGNIYQGSWDGTAGKPEAGILSIKSGNTIWSGSSFLAIGDNISGSFTDVQAKSFSQLSILSSKTNIETVDPTDALDLVNHTDIRSYQYKTDVAEGKTKRYTSLIIDDVNDVSKYYTPDEFTNEERTGRDDGSAVGYLFLAVKELTRRIKTLEEKLHG